LYAALKKETILLIDEVDDTVQRAHQAHLVARHVHPQTRAEWLGAVAAALEDHRDELVELAQLETHLPEARLNGELNRTVFQLRLFARELVHGETFDATIDHLDESWGMGPRPDIRRTNVPLGVIGVFGASNFPFAFSVMGGDSASGLAAGCAVVHKIHEAHLQLGSRTGEIVKEALAAAGAPSGLFATLTTVSAGTALVEHPLVRAVSFTGSARVGRILMDKAAKRAEPIPFYGELGSINPVFVTRNAGQVRGLDILAEYVRSFTLGMGQFCTKPGLLFVPRLGSEETQALVTAVSKAAPARMLTPQLAAGFLDGRATMADRDGVFELVPGGSGEAPAPALFATTVDDVVHDPRIIREEMFGPASIVVQYEDETELIKAAALLEGQLTATIHGEDDDDVEDLVDMLESRVGRVLWNSWPTGVTVTFAQQHGGPYPATTAASATSVGTAAVRRFMRPVSYQSFPDKRLPPALQETNVWGITRRIDGQWMPAQMEAK
jgi:NADP-dependent aldehyde dehydrogenase